jgi:outer membrane protein assembly factor BamB
MPRLSAKQIFAISLVAVVSSCGPPSVWTQFHGDRANQGFILVSSPQATQPRWSVAVGPPSLSSPALAGDGSIFVGNTQGELVGVNSNGVLRFKQPLVPAPAIVSSPTVAPDGNVLAVATIQTDSTFSSTLFSVSSQDGAPNWSVPLRAHYFSTAAPKIWGNGRTYVIILPLQSKDHSAATDLFIFDSAGKLLTHEESCIAITSGYSFDWWRIFTLGGSFSFTVTGIPPEDMFGPLHPSVAVIDGGNSPLIVVSTSCALVAYRWTGSRLQRVWEQDRNGIDASSPVVASSTVVVGRYDGSVRAYDVSTGTPQWTFTASPTTTFKATPAAFGRYVYAVSDTTIFQLDDLDGTMIANRPLTGMSMIVASPALSSNRVYVSSAEGLWSLSPDLKQIVQDYDALEYLSSPAIGPDGTVFVVTSDGFLRAYR